MDINVNSRLFRENWCLWFEISFHNTTFLFSIKQLSRTMILQYCWWDLNVSKLKVSSRMADRLLHNAHQKKKLLFGLVWHRVSSSIYEDQHSILHSWHRLTLWRNTFTQILRGNTSLGPVVKGLHSIVFNEFVTPHSWPII